MNLDSRAIKALLTSGALLVKIKRDLENETHGGLKNFGLVIGRAKFDVFAVGGLHPYVGIDPERVIRTNNTGVRLPSQHRPGDRALTLLDNVVQNTKSRSL